jgi:NTP pyrophosphatase (non-canonical NTP hydrolase)
MTNETDYVKTINQLSKQIFQNNQSVGWWDMGVENRNKGELIALMHSELSEALEGVRKNKADDHLPHRSSEEVELADTIIRIMDYCGAYNFDIGGAIAEKLEYNKQRLDHKRENRSKKDGKRF